MNVMTALVVGRSHEIGTVLKQKKRYSDLFLNIENGDMILHLTVSSCTPQNSKYQL